MSWYRLELKGGLDDVTDRAWREVWKVAYGQSPYDASNGLFRSGRGASCVLYFSPAAVELAATFGAKRCKKPSGEKLVFVAGPDAACDLHFPHGRVSRPADLGAYGDVNPSYISTLPLSSFPSTQSAP